MAEANAEEPPSSEEAVVKKPLSAFFHYCAEQRPAEKLLNPNASAGEITKSISDSWKNLSDEEKKKFLDLALADKERYEKVRVVKTTEAHEILIPIGRVKKIAKLDTEVKSVSKEATAIIAKMTEFFVGKLATETHLASSGKKLIKASDVAYCIHNRPNFAWLRADYPLSEYSQPKTKPKPAPARPENNSSIDAFFPPSKKIALQQHHQQSAADTPAAEDDQEKPSEEEEEEEPEEEEEEGQSQRQQQSNQTTPPPPSPHEPIVTTDA